MNHYLAFDLGASSGRAIIGHFDGNKIELEEIHRFANGPVPVDGHICWDFDALWNEIKTGLKKAVDSGVKLDGIAVDTWGVDYCYLGHDSKFVGKPYHYRDTRTNGAMDWVFQRMSKEDIYALTGSQSLPINSLYQMAASRRDNDKRLQWDTKYLLFMPNAFTYMLCGNISAEYTLASTTQMLDMHKGDWAWKIVDAIGVNRAILPHIAKPCTIAGTLTEELQKELGCEAIPVILTGTHDTASAVASVPADADSSWAYLSSGTWSLLGVELDQPLICQEALAKNYTNEGGICGKIRFLKNIMGLWIIQECRNQWISEGTKYSFGELAQMASDAEPFFAIINPDDPLFVAPGDMPARIREYCEKSGQKVPQSHGQIARIAFESLALRYRQTWLELEALLGKKLDVLHLVGGGCQNLLLNQFTANAINAKVVTGPVEATAAGNMIGQLIATEKVASLWDARKIIRNSFDCQSYEPNAAESAAWLAAYDKFTALPAQL